MASSPRIFAIAQANGLGDVVCSLPLAAAIKAEEPRASVVFIGRPYTRALIESSSLVDRYLDAEAVVTRPRLLAELGVEVFLNPYLSTPLGLAARRAGVGIRVGNLLRPESFQWANRYIAQKSRTVQRHRALLNLAYLRPLGFRTGYSIAELSGMARLDRYGRLPPEIAALLDPRYFNLVLHPKSNGSAPEWPLAHFQRLAELLLPVSRIRIFVTGSTSERELLRRDGGFLAQPEVTDLSGHLELAELIALLSAASGLVSSSTGPLHIAAGLGTHALGLFAGRDRTTRARWHPLGRRAEALSSTFKCIPGSECGPMNRPVGSCCCMSWINPEQVAERVLSWTKSPEMPVPKTVTTSPR